MPGLILPTQIPTWLGARWFPEDATLRCDTGLNRLLRCSKIRILSGITGWGRNSMGWVYLLAAGCAEIVYAAAMPRTEGFTRLGPSLFALIFIGLSMYLLSLATKTIPLGTAYAVWVGIGAIGTAIYGMVFLGEDRSILRMICFLLILAGIVGLKLITTDGKN